MAAASGSSSAKAWQPASAVALSTSRVGSSAIVPWPMPTSASAPPPESRSSAASIAAGLPVASSA